MVNLKKYYLQQVIVFWTKGDVLAEQYPLPNTDKSLVIYSKHSSAQLKQPLRACFGGKK